MTFHLEPATREFLAWINAARTPPLEWLTVGEARAAFEAMQRAHACQIPGSAVKQHEVEFPDAGRVRLCILRPQGATSKLAALLYLHGGGWILGDFSSHEENSRMRHPRPSCLWGIPVRQRSASRWRSSRAMLRCRWSSSAPKNGDLTVPWSQGR